MKKNRPLSIYFTAEERDYLSRLAGHCCRSESEQVRWLVVKAFREVFGESEKAVSSHNTHQRSPKHDAHH